MEATREGRAGTPGMETDAPGTAEAPSASIATETPTGKMLTSTVMRRAANLILDIPLQLAPDGQLIAGELRAFALLLDLEIAKNDTRRGRRAGAVRNLLERIGAVAP